MSILDHEQMPQVAAVMTPFPYFVRPDEPVARVLQLIETHAIRHVPVKEGDQVVGIVSDRDLRWLSGAAGSDHDPGEVLVKDIRLPEPYIVDIHASLGAVVRALQNAGAAAGGCRDQGQGCRAHGQGQCG